MTKEEILEPCIQTHREVQVVELGDAISCMDEYAKQQAIAFASYTAENLWAVYSKTGMWYQHMNEDNPITGEHLYNQFIEQQNKDNGNKGEG